MKSQNNIENFRLFDDYLNHRLDDTERIFFEQSLLNDKQFAESFDLFQSADTLTRIYENQHISSILKNIDYDAFERKEKHKKLLRLTGGIILVVSLATYFLLKLNDTKTTENIPTDSQRGAVSATYTQKHDHITQKTEKRSNKQTPQSKLPAKKQTTTQLSVSQTGIQESTPMATQENHLPVSSSINDKIVLQEKTVIPTKNPTTNDTETNNTHIQITAQINSSNTCPDESNGKITIEEIITAGDIIYISQDNKLVYQGTDKHFTIQNLPAGKYSLEINDNKKSTAFHTEASVETKTNCISKINGVVNISNNQHWTLEAENYERFVYIYAIGGNIVLKKPVAAHETFEWDGTNDNGQILPIGAYLIEVNDSSQKLRSKGAVSIIGY